VSFGVLQYMYGSVPVVDFTSVCYQFPITVLDVNLCMVSSLLIITLLQKSSMLYKYVSQIAFCLQSCVMGLKSNGLYN